MIAPSCQPGREETWSPTTRKRRSGARRRA
jgi:hypothetical protein